MTINDLINSAKRQGKGKDATIYLWRWTKDGSKVYITNETCGKQPKDGVMISAELRIDNRINLFEGDNIA